ncbi:MAG: RNA polymerase sigma factor [Bacteriovoracaceae bacterium]
MKAVETVMKEELFNQINNDYSKALKRICRSYEFNDQKVNELYQEVMTAIWLSLDNFQNDCSAKTWCYRVAYNRCISHSIKESKQTKFSLRSIEEIEHQIESEEFEKKMERRNTLEKIGEILKTMKPLDKEIFSLFLEGEPQKEIALITGLKESNISTKVSRIKKIISSIMEDKQ